MNLCVSSTWSSEAQVDECHILVAASDSDPVVNIPGKCI